MFIQNIFSKLFVTIVVLFISISSYAQVAIVKGVVVDESGTPLLGATIIVEGTTNGVTTDFDGNYLLNVKKENAILVFSYLGFETQKIPLVNQSIVNVILKEDLNSLEEVQVVAFSKQKKSSVIGSVSTINTSDLKLPSTNLTSSFAGQIAGMISYQRSGEPGQDNAEFIIKHNLVVPIMASKGWDKNSNMLIINEKLYDVEKKTWKKKDGKDLKPSIQETVRSYREMVSSSNDKRTGYTQIFADTFSPSMSKDWVDLLIADLNRYIMETDVQRAKNSLKYLNSQINQTAIPELKQVMAQLIKTEQQTIMLSQSSPEYVFKILDKPIIPELKLKPKRAIICIVGTITGFIISLLITIALIFRKKLKIT